MHPRSVPTLLSSVALCAAVALALRGWIATETPVVDTPDAVGKSAQALHRAHPTAAAAVEEVSSVPGGEPTATLRVDVHSAREASAQILDSDLAAKVEKSGSIGQVAHEILHVDALEAGDAAAQTLYKSFLGRIAKEGSVPLIVGLSAPIAPESSPTGPGDLDHQQQRIGAVQDHLLGDLAGVATEGVKRFEMIPYLALTVDARGLAELMRSDPVITVEEDVALLPALLDSVSLIEADTLHTGRTNGTGFTVAILDTGVDKSHPFLDGGKIISEACYSTNRPVVHATSACPGGVAESTAAGSGVACDYPGCDHGTWVAGIAAGKDGTGAKGGTLQGTAPGASVIAIQVFSKFDGPETCDPDEKCIRSYVSDQLKALERVYALRDTYNIAAVNMSLGGGWPAETCDSDSALTASIDNLRAVGIATVISSGNNGYDGATSYPGCISSAITVGASDKQDKLWSGSNHADGVDVIAPGVAIQSSILEGAYKAGNGTSAAAPHVTGCFALFRQRRPKASVTAIEKALESAATVSISRGGISKPRIDCHAALVAPAATTLIAPRGLTSDTTPTYSWNAVADATSYRLWVDRGTDQVRRTWYTAAQAGCAAGTGTCTVTPGTVLQNSVHTWRIRARTPQAVGLWSDRLDFAVNSAPGKATFIPHLRHGLTTRDTTPTYRWNAVSAATSYYLEVGRIYYPIFGIWYTAEQAGCATGTGTCEVTPSRVLREGFHTWRIQTRNRHGTGPWSEKDFFKVDPSPGAVTLLSPQGPTTDTTPTYRWNAVANATYYQLWFRRGSHRTTGGLSYPAQSAGCGTGTGICSIEPRTFLQEGAHTWWILPWGFDGEGAESEKMTFTVRSPPKAATPISPQEPTTDTTPTYSWNAVASVTHYYLWVRRGSSKVIGTWYTAAQAGCAAGSGTCEVTPSAVLQNGTHSWWIQTWSRNGRGPWSARADFAVGAGFPEAATPTSPLGMTTDTTPTYSWNAVAGVTHYYLWVRRGSSKVIGTWYTAAQAGCATGAGPCSITPSAVLQNDTHSWWIQTWSSKGRGPWSRRADFAVGANYAGTTTAISPYGTTSETTLTYRWIAVPTATSYSLWLERGSSTLFDATYTAAEAGCATGNGTCAVTPNLFLPSGAYFWSVRAQNSLGSASSGSAMEFTVRAAPGAVTPISPRGLTIDTTPTYSWNAVPTATSYYLRVGNHTGEITGTWYTATQAECAGGTGTCRIAPTIVLQDSMYYRWWIQPRTPKGLGPRSEVTVFKVGRLPGGALAISPRGATMDTAPRFTWSGVADASSYQLWVGRGSDKVVATWTTPTQAGCILGDRTCSFTLNTVLQNGSYSWWIRTRNFDGLGPRSETRHFTVRAGGESP